MTPDDEGMGTEPEPGVPVWLALTLAAAALAGFVVAVAS